MRKSLIVLLMSSLLALAAGPAFASPAAAADPVYIVQGGDTLFGIAMRYGVTVSALAAANNIANVNLIYPGEQLTIPLPGGSSNPPPAPTNPPPANNPPPTTGGTAYTVQPGDTLGLIAQRFGVSLSALISANNLANPNLIFVGQALTIPGAGPAPAPTQPPSNNPPPATSTPVAVPPTPTSQPGAGGTNGIATLQFNMHQTIGTPHQDMFFTFQVVNNTASAIHYGILAAHTDQGVTADSWHDPLLPGKSVLWTDHINFPNTGTYQVYLGICYGDHNSCKSGSAPWTRLSDSVTVTIN